MRARSRSVGAFTPDVHTLTPPHATRAPGSLLASPPNAIPRLQPNPANDASDPANEHAELLDPIAAARGPQPGPEQRPRPREAAPDPPQPPASGLPRAVSIVAPGVSLPPASSEGDPPAAAGPSLAPGLAQLSVAALRLNECALDGVAHAEPGEATRREQLEEEDSRRVEEAHAREAEQAWAALTRARAAMEAAKQRALDLAAAELQAAQAREQRQRLREERQHVRRQQRLELERVRLAREAEEAQLAATRARAAEARARAARVLQGGLVDPEAEAGAGDGRRSERVEKLGRLLGLVADFGQEFPPGARVRVKSAAVLQAYRADPRSQWRLAFGASKKDHARLLLAGCEGRVARADPADATLLVVVSGANAASEPALAGSPAVRTEPSRTPQHRAWFTRECLEAIGDPADPATCPPPAPALLPSDARVDPTCTQRGASAPPAAVKVPREVQSALQLLLGSALSDVPHVDALLASNDPEDPHALAVVNALAKAMRDPNPIDLGERDGSPVPAPAPRPHSADKAADGRASSAVLRGQREEDMAWLASEARGVTLSAAGEAGHLAAGAAVRAIPSHATARDSRATASHAAWPGRDCAETL